MKAKRSRTNIDPLVRSFVEEEARAEPKATARIIRARVARRLRTEGDNKPLPKVRAIQVIAKKAREEPGYTLDDPWNLGYRSPDVPADATGDLLAVWRLRLQQGRRLTIRQARWVARLRSALPDADPQDLLVWSTLYERRERGAKGRRQMLNTVDLDAELAFQVWQSPFHVWEYQQAVLTGAVPYHGPIGPQVETLWSFQHYPIVNEYLLGYARRFLREVGGDSIDQQPWWPQAESVMAFWLREISTRVEKWRLIGIASSDRDDPKIREEWEAMGRRLAGEVITWAGNLDQWNKFLAGRISSPVGCPPKTWRPTALLKEIGYPGLKEVEQ